VADGYKLFKAKNYEEALAKLEAAYAVEPKMGTLKTIAHCQVETKRAAAAYATYERLLTVHAKQISKKEKRDADTALLGLKQQTGTVRITATQAGAAVKLDQRDVTAEQLSVPIRLDAGKHKVSATLAGFEPLQADVDVVPAKDVPFEIRLVPESRMGRIRVVEPNGLPVHVLVDGKDVGTAPWEGDLEPGQHTAALRGDKLTSEVRMIDVAVKSRSELAIATVAAAPPPAPKARYALTTVPPNAQLVINGQPMPSLSGELAPGMYKFVLSAPGCWSMTKQVNLTTAQPLAETVTLPPLEP
jgi:hypothetical protein